MSFLDGPQTSLSHQTRYTVLPTDYALRPQLGMNTWTARDLPSLLIGLADLLGQLLIFQLTMTGFSLAPGIVAAFRNSK
jgi:hypothetical protein